MKALIKVIIQRLAIAKNDGWLRTWDDICNEIQKDHSLPMYLRASISTFRSRNPIEAARAAHILAVLMRARVYYEERKAFRIAHILKLSEERNSANVSHSTAPNYKRSPQAVRGRGAQAGR